MVSLLVYHTSGKSCEGDRLRDIKIMHDSIIIILQNLAKLQLPFQIMVEVHVHVYSIYHRCIYDNVNLLLF